jgi:HPt (histidine-containing phosphotransfer) domain-containing protein
LNSKTLLAQLSYLEQSLQNYSYEKLPANDARQLKECLAAFREQLELKMQRQSGAVHENQGTRVHSIDINQRRTKSTSEATTLPISENLEPLSKSRRFTEYLKDSPLTEEQLAYINAILASSDITTRVSNEPNEDPAAMIGGQADINNSKKSNKINPMNSSRKNTSEAVNPNEHAKGMEVKIDLAPVLADCLGQLDLLEELIRLYKQNALEFIGQVKLHLQNLDFEGIRFAAHKIKSGLKMMKTLELLAIAEQIEAASKADQDLKHLDFLFGCFVKEYPAIERAIDAELVKLK